MAQSQQTVELKGMTLEELEAFAEREGEPRYRGRQIAHWLYQRGATSFAEMTDLPAALRAHLAEDASVTSLSPVTALTADGGDTIKYLLGLSDGNTIETVFMRYQDGRRSVCISTQVGCGMGCTFCATGLAGLTRNLSAAEIIDQVILVQRLTGERVTNVVFMGMGEPLANYEATLRAVRLLNAPYGLGIGMRHLTVSTVGLVPQIRALASERLQLTLAVSLHAPTDELRSDLVPINRKWPVAALLDASGEYVRQTGRRISFEYVLMEHVNDTPELAAILGDLLRTRLNGAIADDGPDVGIPIGVSQGEVLRGGLGYAFHVNLIPWNPVYGLQYRRPGRERVEAFVRELRARGIPTTVRLERGVEIDAACGQLQRTKGTEMLGLDATPRPRDGATAQERR
ncbi:MAG: 23S rRNA (adenine(2503)-C(2))-methyltransferase RlmN [Bacillati bacterium ANGP1]|uniref:Probable dual-specificity RNA methyltransferase RlmN n=1 Tax=Candidatus Segetimicrobium genomatis TaxID=2569760 RepID=A0A537IMC5_9BACT|nr:MAG: 23S rRNA (adenine(2503)-C(2))-methyltransferase RlmN [Terrabacteria group bacterium ANGP1]